MSKIVNKSDVKAVGAVVVGVMLAGWVMSQFGNVSLIAQARSGYDY